MADDAEPQRWVPAFNVITYSDPAAIAKPHLKARGRKVHGPFKEYGDAELYAQQINCTHYSIDKITVKPSIHPRFLNFNGDRLEPELFPSE